MPRIITAEQFHEAIPDYIEQAHELAVTILDHAIANPVSDVQVRATVFDASALPDYRRYVSDPDELAELWTTRDRLQTLEADVPVDNGRLALENFFSDIGGRVRVWTYGLGERAITASAGVDDEGARLFDWISSETRADLSKLTMPGYTFHQGCEGFEIRPSITAYVYTPREKEAGKRHYSGASGVANIPPDQLKTAIAPHLTQADMRLLEDHSVETYHTAKIERLLKLLGGVARQGA